MPFTLTNQPLSNLGRFTLNLRTPNVKKVTGQLDEALNAAAT